MSIVILTGAPGVGKSTLCRGLVSRYPGVMSVNFGEFLREYRMRNNSEAGCDEAFVRMLSRTIGDVIVDSHGVTRTAYGWKYEPFKGLGGPRVGAYVLVTAAPELILARRQSDVKERTLETLVEIGVHQRLLEAELVSSCNACGVPGYVVQNDGCVDIAVGRLEGVLREAGIVYH